MHGFANPARFLRIARWLTPLLLVSGVVLTAAALAWGLFKVPPDRLMGETVRISLCGNSDFDTKLYVYENAHTPGAPHACNDDSCSTPSFPDPYVSQLLGVNLTAGNTYYIVVDGWDEQSGNYTLLIN